MVKETGNPRFVWDAYRRFVMMFSDVAMGLAKEEFEHKFTELKHQAGREAGHRCQRRRPQEARHRHFSADGQGQAWPRFPRGSNGAARAGGQAVFESWDNPRAQVYRKKEKISDDLGTAVQRADDGVRQHGRGLGHGRRFTRNAATGEKKLYGRVPDERTGRGRGRRVRTRWTSRSLPGRTGDIQAVSRPSLRKLEDHYREMRTSSSRYSRGGCSSCSAGSGKRTEWRGEDRRGHGQRAL